MNLRGAIRCAADALPHRSAPLPALRRGPRRRGGGLARREGARHEGRPRLRDGPCLQRDFFQLGPFFKYMYMFITLMIFLMKI